MVTFHCIYIWNSQNKEKIENLITYILSHTQPNAEPWQKVFWSAHLVTSLGEVICCSLSKELWVAITPYWGIPGEGSLSGSPSECSCSPTCIAQPLNFLLLWCLPCFAHCLLSEPLIESSPWRELPLSQRYLDHILKDITLVNVESVKGSKQAASAYWRNVKV